MVCHGCGGAAGDLVLCDGNCGHAWHVACAATDDSSSSTEGGGGLKRCGEALYCSACEQRQAAAASWQGVSLDPLMQEEIASLKRALANVQRERLQQQHSQSLDKELLVSAHETRSALLDQQQVALAALQAQLADERAARGQLSAQIGAVLRENAALQHQEQTARLELLRVRREHQQAQDAAAAEAEILRRRLDAQDHQLLQAARAAANSSRKNDDAHERELARLRLELSEKAAAAAAMATKAAGLPLSPSRSPPKSNNNNHSINSNNSSRTRPVTAFEGVGASRPASSSVNIQNWWSGSNSSSSSDDKDADPLQAGDPGVTTTRRPRRTPSDGTSPTGSGLGSSVSDSALPVATAAIDEASAGGAFAPISGSGTQYWIVWY